MRTQAKRDRNERAIIVELERLGCWVQQLSDPGVPDLWVHDRRTTLDYLFEVKTPGEKLTPTQSRWWERAPSSVRKFVVRTAEEACWIIESGRGSVSSSS